MLRLASEEVEAIGDRQERVAVDAVILRVRAPHGVDHAREVALLVEDIVELERDRERLATQEALRHLGVPKQFVAVERGVVVASAAVHVEVRGEARAPGRREVDGSAIGEAPGVEVLRRLQLVLRVVVLHRPIEGHLQPTVAIAEGQSLAEVGLIGDVALHEALPRLLQERGVAVEIDGREGVDIPYAQGVDARVEHHARVQVPVAIDVDGPHHAGSRTGVVGHAIADGVVDGGEVEESHPRLRISLPVAIVERVDAMGEGGSQTRVADADVLRVGIVRDVEQLAHRGLRGRSAVEEAEVALWRELIAEVDRRTPVEGVAHGIDVDAEVVLLVDAVLRLELHAGVESPLLLVHADHELDVLRMGLVLRVAAQRLVEVVAEGLLQQGEVAAPGAVGGLDAIEVAAAKRGEVVGGSVALAQGIVVLVGQLQVGAAGDGLAIGGLHADAVALGRHEVVAVGAIDGVLAHGVEQLVVLQVLGGEGLGVGVVVVALQPERDVAPVGRELAVDLQRGLCRGVVSIGHGRVALAVDQGALGLHGREQVVGERVVALGIGIFGEGGRGAHVEAVALAELQAWPEHHVPHRVGGPLQAEAPVPAVGPRVLLADAARVGMLRGQEVVGEDLGLQVAVVVVPAQGSVPLPGLAVVVVHVDARHLGVVESLAGLSESAPSAAAKHHVADVVGREETHHAEVVLEVGRHATLAIAPVVAHGEVDVGEESFVHAFLHAEVEHGLLFAVVDARDTGQVALLVVGLHLVDDGGGEVLQRRLGIAGHKLLAIHEDLLHLLAVDLDRPVVADLCAGQHLDQGLDGRSLCHAVGGGVILEGVILEHDLRGLGGDRHLAQHMLVGLEREGADLLVLAASDHDVVADRAHTDERDLEDVAAVARGGKRKAACVVARRARDVGAVRSQQLDDGVAEGLLVLAVDERARDGLCLGRDAHQGQERHQDYTDSLSYIHLVLV